MRLNNKGFAISGVLYSMLILIVTLMFLVLGILAGRRTTLSKINNESRQSVEDRVVIREKTVCSSIDFSSSVYFQYNSAQEEVEYELTPGFYLIQAWGASGTKYDSYIGGKGAYVATIYEATETQNIYLNMGNGFDNMLNSSATVYNGGGVSLYGGSGGGATSVATVSGELSTLEDDTASIILVAAGGGGAGYQKAGGAGGNLVSGADGSGSYTSYAGKGATETAGGAGGSAYKNNSSSSGKAGSFGLGGAAGSSTSGYGGGGGSGYYGGGGGTAYSSSRYGSGGGGVSYIDASLLSRTNKIMESGGIFTSKPDYKQYIGVGINGNGVMPEALSVQTESILTQTQIGNSNTGAVRITKMSCITTIE